MGSRGEVLPFPPLPPVPEPPTGPTDDRQQAFERLAGILTGQLFEESGQAATANLASGFRASAVDLGQLQEIIGNALALFDMAQVRARWDIDLFSWMRQTLLTWIQRCKYLNFDLGENGIRIKIQTQVDRGYYHYELDVFPGRTTEGIVRS